MNFFRTLLTTKDNQSYDLFRIFAAAILLSTIAVLFCGVHYYLKAFDETTKEFTKTFDIMTLFNAYDIMLGALAAFLGALAGALKLKQSTEPEKQNDTNNTGQ